MVVYVVGLALRALITLAVNHPLERELFNAGNVNQTFELVFKLLLEPSPSSSAASLSDPSPYKKPKPPKSNKKFNNNNVLNGRGMEGSEMSLTESLSGIDSEGSENFSFSENEVQVNPNNRRSEKKSRRDRRKKEREKSNLKRESIEKRGWSETERMAVARQVALDLLGDLMQR